MKDKLKLLGLAAGIAGSLTSQAEPAGKTEEPVSPTKKNVLLIIVDDMRPELRCYGHEDMVTPNIDALAARGVRFDRAYCNVAVSGATRASLLTGTLPTRHTFQAAHLRAQEQKPDKIGLNDFLHDNGYITAVSSGKTYHYQDDHKSGWDIIRQRKFEVNDVHTHEGQEEGRRPLPYECLDLPDTLYRDGVIASQAVRELQGLAKQEKPFFYALGFYRPHLPFNAPKKYWDLYDRSKLSLPDNYVLKEGNHIPERALTTWGELRKYSGTPKRGPLSDEMALNLIHGYHAAVSFVDAQIGRVIDELDRLGLSKNTVVILLGDHGWSLGEHGCWCKHTILETSIRVPFIIVDPDGVKGYDCSEVVEYLSIFPTVCDLTGLPKPAQLEGQSIAPLLKSREARSKGWAFCRWNQGYTLVTKEGYSYTEWWDKQDKVLDRLLFDHNTDPDENFNVVDRPQYKSAVDSLSILLKARRGPEFDKYGPESGITYKLKH